jgi:translocator protein
MYLESKKYLSLIIWIIGLITIGSMIGSLSQSEITTWYITLNHSRLTPPNVVFPIAWTILYTIIAICGWLVWRTEPFSQLKMIKRLYVIQLILNWSWTPLFFHYHWIGISLFVLILMDIFVALLIILSYSKIRLVSQLMLPYLLWIFFASYLNFHLWLYH